MKLFVIILGIAVIFAFIFIKSGAWEVEVTTGDKEGVEVAKRKHRIHWDRFFRYIRDIPTKISRMWQGSSKVEQPVPNNK